MGGERESTSKAETAVETTVREWLGLDDVEMAVVDLRVRLAVAIRRRRGEAGLSQAELAERVGVSQARISAAEDATGVSLDAMVRAFLAAGGNLDDLAAVVADAS